MLTLPILPMANRFHQRSNKTLEPIKHNPDINPIKIQQPSFHESIRQPLWGTRSWHVPQKPCPLDTKKPSKGKTIRLLYRAVSRLNTGERIGWIERVRKKLVVNYASRSVELDICEPAITEFHAQLSPLVITYSMDLWAIRPFRHEPPA